MTTQTALRDLQSETDHRNLEIQKAGVKGLSYPIVVQDRANGTQHTVARIQMSVSLPHHFRGTHMSRFIEILNRHRGNIASDNLREILAEAREKLDAEVAHMELEFPYFIEKSAPVSGAKALQEYICRFSGSLGVREKDTDFILEVNVPVTTLCPCSKEISDYGAHNQRSVLTIAVKFKSFVWIEDLVEIAENSASCALFPLLKRRDEKYVTERAYDNPRFVEDVVRECALLLEQMDEVTWYRVEAENFESIHNHNAYALIENRKNGK
ncbi:MAG: GTP cyclohydrolase [Candidatus Glassbacteria bacterium RIFCSPLOWO2_12_FULL_58_11]|uniref:GTP cyclohydrolase FolE2 n=1 Tax=Candidatus Glassbacteria bacterium RIFCSPLOWO2_12_FULL_58_11 TaxID=1817867 RepID=A0A1F5YRL3_9BACT|nr:MAG: GTP cyclohydrolase [Candidatus Glassbacteria bacterium RIFCSPLOWO2_12_FULL_58_11]